MYPFMIPSTTKKTQLFFLYSVYRPKKNASRTNIMNCDQKAYAFAPTYVDGSTAFHRHMISVVVFYYLNKLQSMSVDNAVTEMGCFGDYSYAEPRAKKMRGDCITTFLLHVSQCITFTKN